MSNKLINLAGHKFGRLLVLGLSGKTKSGKYQWACACDCGTTALVVGADLKSGNTQSCGCFAREVSAATGRARATHGQSRKGHKTTEYSAYLTARQRCWNPNNRAWKDYGGRGIRFLFESFRQFIAHIGIKPPWASDLDRIDNNGNYEIGNVRWVSEAESVRNRRCTKLNEAKVAEIRSRYSAGDVTQASLAVEYGIDRQTVGDVVTGRTWADILPPKKPSASVTVSDSSRKRSAR